MTNPCHPLETRIRLLFNTSVSGRAGDMIYTLLSTYTISLKEKGRSIINAMSRGKTVKGSTRTEGMDFWSEEFSIF
jgi:hypothetical protein